MPEPKKKTERKKAQAAYSPPNLFPVYPYSPLSLEERVEFREFMARPVFAKLIRNAYCRKPSSMAVSGGVAKWDQHSTEASSHRLHQIQGWEMFEAAFFQQAEERIVRQNKPLEEQYQEPGT